jgi:ADP-ribose pyrophosphatase YjhB (NUDIX family)
MNYPVDLFRFCPKCGVALAELARLPLTCAGCGFVYFFNPTVAAGAFLFNEDKQCLFIRRAKEPAQGKLAIPGGFIDFQETAEAALEREVFEEVGLKIEQIRYLGSCTNDYLYRDVVYPVVDLIFAARAIAPDQAQALDGVAGLEWMTLQDINPEELAFPSLRMGWMKLMQEASCRSV